VVFGKRWGSSLNRDLGKVKPPFYIDEGLVAAPFRSCLVNKRIACALEIPGANGQVRDTEEAGESLAKAI
jgi:hypothetical protein